MLSNLRLARRTALLLVSLTEALKREKWGEGSQEGSDKPLAAPGGGKTR